MDVVVGDLLGDCGRWFLVFRAVLWAHALCRWYGRIAMRHCGDWRREDSWIIDRFECDDRDE